MVNKRRDLDYRRRSLKEEVNDGQFVIALARGLELLRCFEPGDSFLGNQELVERSGFSKATVSRLTYTLVRLGYLNYHTDKSRYSLGSAVLVTAHSLLVNMRVRRYARPLMQEMANQVQGVVSLGIRHGMAMMYVESCASDLSGSPVVVGLGSRIPLVRSAMGRAYLASLPEASREELMQQIKARDPRAWPTTKEHIRQALVCYGRNGFCMSDQDLAQDSRAVGVGLKCGENEVQMAFNCGVPTFRLAPRQLELDIGPRLRGLVRHIETVMRSL